MKNYKIKTIGIFLIMGPLAVFSCTESQVPSMSAEELAELSKQDTVSIILNSNDKMQFDKTDITVFEGQTVILRLNHTGSMPIEAMGHNFVLLTNDISVSDFGKQAVSAKANEYIPADKQHVIAHTRLIGGGETDTIIFEAPKKGTYDFVCSFSGHYSIMKGKFNVK